MSKSFLPEITYMRGLCMLGVIAIHVGSYALSNPLANPQLISFLEILSRFSIPAFFFLSAFGLFYHSPVAEPLSYKHFMKRRMTVVLLPYLTWSVLYTAYTAWQSHTWAVWAPGYFTVSLLFGTACYQLYFLVIIFWFYLFMPVWRAWVRRILAHPVRDLSILFFVQMAVDYYISYHIGAIHFANPVWQYLLDMRLNYWVLPYIWVFLFGAVVAERYRAFCQWIEDYSGVVVLSGLAATVGMLAAYYYVISAWHYTLLEATYTIHQLSPMGLIYTAAMIPFFILLFRITPKYRSFHLIWDSLGRYSYGMYLVHPLVLYLLTPLIARFGLSYSFLVVVNLYVLTVVLSFYLTNRMEASPRIMRLWLLGNQR